MWFLALLIIKSIASFNSCAWITLWFLMIAWISNYSLYPYLTRSNTWIFSAYSPFESLLISCKVRIISHLGLQHLTFTKGSKENLIWRTSTYLNCQSLWEYLQLSFFFSTSSSKWLIATICSANESSIEVTFCVDFHRWMLSFLTALCSTTKVVASSL